MIVRERDWLAKVIRYGCTGGAAAVVDLCGFIILIGSGVHLSVAATLSFLAASIVNYGLTARFVFGTQTSIRKYLRFMTFASLGLALNVFVTIMADAAGSPETLAKLTGIAVAFGANFLLNVLFAFPQAKGKQE